MSSCAALLESHVEMARSKLLDLEQQFTFYVSPISLPVSLASGPSKVAAPLRLLSTADAPCSNTHQQAWSCTGAKDFQTSVLTSHAPKTGFRLPQASYHTNQVNVLIHIFCVPTILFTALILAHGIPGASKSLATVPLDLFGRHIDLDLTFPFLWPPATPPTLSSSSPSQAYVSSEPAFFDSCEALMLTR